MVHRASPPPTSKEILSKLGCGDILTHAFRGEPNSLLTSEGLLIPELYAARERGVVIDIGHGRGSFSIEIARKILKQKFYPDVISSDLHAGSINESAYDLPTIMSKFLSLGMNLNDVVSSVTCNPAKVINKNDQLGNLRKGTEADIAVFELKKGNFEYMDGTFVGADVRESNKFYGEYRLENKMTIISGEIIS